MRDISDSKSKSSSIMSVTALNEKIKSLLEATFYNISVEGEIASVTYHSSGHIYFSIKDENSSIKCVMWRSNASRLKFTLKKGEHIVLRGSLGVYTPRGDYQFIAQSIEPYGKGALALAFEQLKEKLQAKGYFDKARKKPLPKFPKKIAIVTALGGAALQDMLNIASRRWPLVEIVVFDTLVQGEDAPKEIARAIARADRCGADIIIVGRGGGAIEDLWAFNEEIVADAIYNASTVIVSAVGHEVDTLISDFVADLRAPTPSAAMEIILPDSNELLIYLDDILDRYRHRIEAIIRAKEERLKSLESSIKSHSAINRLKMLEDRFSSLKNSLDEAIRYKISKFEAELIPIRNRLEDSIYMRLRQKQESLNSLKNSFEINNPTLKTKEGWAEITVNGKRVPLSSLKVGETFSLTDSSTTLKAKVIETN